MKKKQGRKLKLGKETLRNISEHEAPAVQGGASDDWSHYRYTDCPWVAPTNRYHCTTDTVAP